MGLCLALYSVLLNCILPGFVFVVLFYQYHIVLITSFVIQFEIRKCDASTFNRDCIESIDYFEQYEHFNNVNSSNPQARSIFTFLCVFNFFFFFNFFFYGCYREGAIQKLQNAGKNTRNLQRGQKQRLRIFFFLLVFNLLTYGITPSARHPFTPTPRPPPLLPPLVRFPELAVFMFCLPF